MLFFVIFALLQYSIKGAPFPLLYSFLVHIVNRGVSEQLFGTFSIYIPKHVIYT